MPLGDRPTRSRLVFVSLAAATLAVLFAPSVGVPATAVRAHTADLTTAVPDPSWHQLFPATEPTFSLAGFSWSAPLVWDPVDRELVTTTIEGPTANGSFSTVTWAYHSGDWHRLPIFTPPLGLAQAAWDYRDGYLVLVSGAAVAPPGGPQQTWTFVGDTWKRIFPDREPSGGWGAGMTWDGAIQKVLFFGTDRSTWVFSGGEWRELFPTHNPSSRRTEALGFDARTGEAILYGGAGPAQGGGAPSGAMPATGPPHFPCLSDTWGFTGTDWVNLSAGVSPGPRCSASFAFDPSLQELVLYAEDEENASAQTWAFGKGGWQLENANGAGGAVGIAQMAYDPTEGGLILLNESDQVVSGPDTAMDTTWEYSTTTPTATYPLIFTEAGLRPATLWSITLAGTTLRSYGSSITFDEPNGSYTYTVGAVPGYSAQPSYSSVTVDGWAVSQPISFATIPAPLTTYPVTFVETGLLPGASWSVTLGAATKDAPQGAVIGFEETNGSYSFRVGGVPGYIDAPASGTITVSGSQTTRSIDFHPVGATGTQKSSAGRANPGLPTIEVSALIGVSVGAAVLVGALALRHLRRPSHRRSTAVRGGDPDRSHSPK